MDRIVSRKDPRLRHFRRLGREREYRRETGLFLCEGEKLLDEARRGGAAVRQLLYREGGAAPEAPPGAERLTAPGAVFDYASALEHSPGPLFTVERATLPAPPGAQDAPPRRVLVLENLQDPGNVGTLLRTAAALGTELVVLLGECADPLQPKAARAAMGALFRQPFWETELPALTERLSVWGLPLYGAALRGAVRDVRELSLCPGAVAVGNEGKGLSEALLARCRERVILPMTAGSESLNAAAAGALLMWEMIRGGPDV